IVLTGPVSAVCRAFEVELSLYRHPRFYFSSRRRHTRSYGDWSSDVCSSDLGTMSSIGQLTSMMILGLKREIVPRIPTSAAISARSEERRVGKEGGPGWVVF